MRNNKNILFIVADQLRYDALSWVDTPNLDRLAEQSCVFERHTTTVVPCGPARASLLTGSYAFNHGSYVNGAHVENLQHTLGTEVRKVGLEPLLFGYTDFTPDPTNLHPLDPDRDCYENVAPGFREVVDMRFESGYDWIADLLEKGYEVPRPLPERMMQVFRAQQLSNKTAVENIKAPAIYSSEDSDTAYLTNRVLGQLEARKDHPWFFHVNYIRPHPPLVAPYPYNELISHAPLVSENKLEHPFTRLWKEYAMADVPYVSNVHQDIRNLNETEVRDLRSIYLGLVAELDFHIGRLLDWLEKNNQKDNTLMVFTADHGDMLGDKKQWGKISIFEPAYSVPLMICHPDYSHKKVHDLTQSIDLMPTILDYLDVLDSPSSMAGRSLTPFLNGFNHGRDYSVSEVDFSNFLDSSSYKTIFELGERSEPCRAVMLRRGKYKYVHFTSPIPSLLFDLEKDPLENHNLLNDGKYQLVGEELKKILLKVYKNPHE